MSFNFDEYLDTPFHVEEINLEESAEEREIVMTGDVFKENLEVFLKGYYISPDQKRIADMLQAIAIAKEEQRPSLLAEFAEHLANEPEHLIPWHQVCMGELQADSGLLAIFGRRDNREYDKSFSITWAFLKDLMEKSVALISEAGRSEVIEAIVTVALDYVENTGHSGWNHKEYMEKLDELFPNSEYAIINVLKAKIAAGEDYLYHLQLYGERAYEEYLEQNPDIGLPYIKDLIKGGCSLYAEADIMLGYMKSGLVTLKQLIEEKVAIPDLMFDEYMPWIEYALQQKDHESLMAAIKANPEGARTEAYSPLVPNDNLLELYYDMMLAEGNEETALFMLEHFPMSAKTVLKALVERPNTRSVILAKLPNDESLLDDVAMLITEQYMTFEEEYVFVPEKINFAGDQQEVAALLETLHPMINDVM